MPFTFRKKIKLFPGVSLNLNKKSVSVTTKVGRVSHTESTSGRRTTSVDIPGPVGYRKQTTRKSRKADGR